MKNLIVRFALSLTLTMGLIGCMFNTFNRFVPTKPVVHKIIEAPLWITPVVWQVWYFIKGFEKGSPRSGKNPMPPPEPCE